MLEIVPLKDYPGYGVSADGRVWTKKKRGRGCLTEYATWREKKQTNGAYLMVWLSQKKGPVDVHVLVALAFLGGIPKGYEVNHKDGNTHNNHVDNLEVVTKLQNLQHAWQLGLNKVAKPKLTPDIVREIRKLAAQGIPQKVIAQQFGLDQSGVSDIHLRKTWKHI